MNWKKDELTIISNKIRIARQEKLELEKLLPILEENKRNMGLKKYLDKNMRQQILSKAEILGYSKCEIDRMTAYIDNWNQDNVTIEIIEDFEYIENYVKQYAKKNEKSFLYKIGNMGKDGGIVNGN